MTKWLVAFAALAGLAACGVGEVPGPPGEAGAGDAAVDAKAAAADDPEAATAQPNAAVTTATR